MAENRKSAHNARVRARILEAALRDFCARGYDGAGINTVMQAAGLTRGAFYAHFASKEALFVETLAQPCASLTRLRERGPENDSTTLWAACLSEVTAWLNPLQFAETWATFPLASLAMDACRESGAAQRAYEKSHRDLLVELARGQDFTADNPALIAGLSTIIGSLSAAAASASAPRRTLILLSAQDIVSEIWTPLAPSDA